MRRVAIAACAVASLLAACGSDTPKGLSGAAIKPIAVDLPTKILDLEVHKEPIEPTVAVAKNTYVTEVSLYSLRNENLAVATLQVSRLSRQFRYREERERAALADKIGGSRAQQYRLGADTVYVTQGQRQRISIWFRDATLFVLSSREDFARPRNLLRAALEVRV